MKGQSIPESASISQQVLVGIKMIPRMLGKAPSVRPSTQAISSLDFPFEQRASALPSTQIPTPALTQTPLPGPVSSKRFSHIPSISPSIGMRGVLYHKDLQLTILYLEKIPYTGDPVTQPVGIVEPWPKLVVGARLFVFVNGEHFEVEITAIAPRLTRSTVSEVISGTLEDDKMRAKYFQEHFHAVGPSTAAGSTLEPLPEENLPSSPVKSPHNQSSGLPNVAPSSAMQVSPGLSPRRARSTRTRTASDAAVQTSQEECRVRQATEIHSPRPSESASPMKAVSTPKTPIQRRRTLSETAASPLAKRPDVVEVPRHINTIPIASFIRSTIAPEDTVPKGGLLTSAKALWENTVLFPKRKKETGVPGSKVGKFISVEKATHTDLPVPRSPIAAAIAHIPRSSWVTQPEWATAKSDQIVEEDRLVDQLETTGSAGSSTMQAREARRINPAPIDKGKQRERSHLRGSVVRVPLTNSPGPSVASTGRRLSNAESRKSSSRKDLPPIPATTPLLLSSESVQEEVAERSQAQQKHLSTVGSLGAALELTPPVTPSNSGSSKPVESTSNQEPKLGRTHYHRYNNNDAPTRHKDLGSSSTTMATTRSSSSMVKHTQRDQRDQGRAMKRTLRPVSSDDMLAFASTRGSVGSIRTPINRNSGAVLEDASPAPSWAEMYKRADKVLLVSDYQEGIPLPIDAVNLPASRARRKTQTVDRGSGAWLAPKDHDVERRRSRTRVRAPIEKF